MSVHRGADGVQGNTGCAILANAVTFGVLDVLTDVGALCTHAGCFAKL